MGLIRLRQSAARTQSGGKSRGNAMAARWNPPSFTKIRGSLTPQEEALVAEPIVFIEGDYVDFYDVPQGQQPTSLEAYHHRSHRYVLHKQGRKQFRTLPCTRGPDPYNPKPCVICYYIDHKQMDEKSSGIRDSWCFNVAHLVTYHQSPLVKDGVIQTKKNSNEPIIVERACQFGTVADRLYWTQTRRQAQCEYCAAGHPVKFGSHRYWEVGKNHLDAILDWSEKTLGKICFWTGTGIVHVGFRCRNCQYEMMQIASSGMTNDALTQFERTPQPCPHCQQVLPPVRTFDSGYDIERGFSKIPNFQMPIDPETGQPATPRPLEIFDVVVWVQREGESTDSKPVVTRWERLTQASFGQGGATMDISQFVSESLVPRTFDFTQMFDMDTDLQAKLLDQPNPYGQQTQQQGFHQYGQAGGSFGGPTLPPPPAPGTGYAPQQAYAPQQTYAPQPPQGYAAQPPGYAPQQPPPQQAYQPPQAPQQPQPYQAPAAQGAPRPFGAPPAPPATGQAPPAFPPQAAPPAPPAPPQMAPPPPPAPPIAAPYQQAAPAAPPPPPSQQQPAQMAPPAGGYAPLPGQAPTVPGSTAPPLPPPAPIPGHGNS